MKNKSNFLDSLSRMAICSKWRIWFVVPMIIILAGLMTFFIIGGLNDNLSDGINAGIDFEGGTILTVELGKTEIDANYDKHVADITKIIEDHGVSVNYVQTTEGTDETNYAIEFRYQNSSRVDTEAAATNDAIRDEVKALYPSNDIAYESISATASSNLIKRALIAVAVSAALILIYIMIRFEPMSAIAAIIALLHDVLIMLAVTVITRMQVNSSYIAAMITIIAYSINNTIIIFDRVRELKKPYGRERFNYEDIGDHAIRSTFTRSVYTTFTTLITILLLTIMGVNAIREFALPIMIGLLAGMYSSMVVATPLWCRFMRLKDYIVDKRLEKKNPALAAAQKRYAATTAVKEQAEDKPKPAKKPQQTYSNKYHKNTKFKK